MSVYIRISHANLKNQPSERIFVMICSKDSIIITPQVLASLKPSWESCFVSSLKQKKLQINLYQTNPKKQQFEKYLGGNTLSFTIFQKMQEFIDNYPLSLLKNQINVGDLIFNIRYVKNINYIGPIRFYDPKIKQTSQKLIKNQGDSKQDYKVQFYKGACPTKNIFSILDADLPNQSFHFIESKYQD